tara:strand:- start:198 stop:323 length:126 start_codon:yes stop_codon:yes gene_type:complete
MKKRKEKKRIILLDKRDLWKFRIKTYFNRTYFHFDGVVNAV